jgi:hypothetical protein
VVSSYSAANYSKVSLLLLASSIASISNFRSSEAVSLLLLLASIMRNVTALDSLRVYLGDAGAPGVKTGFCLFIPHVFPLRYPGGESS